MALNQANSTNEDTFGDLSIKDMTQITYSNSFSEKKSAPTAYVCDTPGATGTNYSHQELDSTVYSSLVPEV